MNSESAWLYIIVFGLVSLLVWLITGSLTMALLCFFGLPLFLLVGVLAIAGYSILILVLIVVALSSMF